MEESVRCYSFVKRGFLARGAVRPEITLLSIVGQASLTLLHPADLGHPSLRIPVYMLTRLGPTSPRVPVSVLIRFGPSFLGFPVSVDFEA